MKLQVKEIIGTDCEAFTNNYNTADKAYKVFNDMKNHLIQSGYVILADTENHVLAEKVTLTGVKVVKSLLVF
jgi:hypothetical protein